MGKFLGYFALLLGSLMVQTLPWGGAAPLGLLLAALVAGCREGPLPAALYGALCGGVWGAAAGRGGGVLALALAAAALGAWWITTALRLPRGWFLLLGAGAALAGVLLTGILAGPSWQLAGVFGSTVLVSPLWGLAAGRGRDGETL